MLLPSLTSKTASPGSHQLPEFPNYGNVEISLLRLSLQIIPRMCHGW